MTCSARTALGPKLVALTGGVGGAKLIVGFSEVMAAGDLTVIANTGDDFEHLGFSISPDIDTLMYTLAGLANPETGWGRAGETWSFMDATAEIGGETWFRLGDKDIAVLAERTWRLKSGQSLSQITRHLCRQLGVDIEIVPMSDEPVRTIVETPGGPLAFQHYFVRERCRPAVTGFTFAGAAAASPQAAFVRALEAPDLSAVIICPSNPFISIDPILSVPGVRGMLAEVGVPVIAVAPIVAGRAIKGPTAKMMAELGLEPSAVGIARHYAGLLDGMIIDHADGPLADEIRGLGVAVEIADTVMTGLAGKIRLAATAMEFAQSLGAELRHRRESGHERQSA